jgi:hypothetical protein
VPFLVVSATVRVLHTTDCTGGSIPYNSPYFVFLSFGVLKNISVVFTLIPCVCGVLYFFSIVSLAISSLLMVTLIVFQCLCVLFLYLFIFSLFLFLLFITFSIFCVSVFLSLNIPSLFLASVLFSFYAAKKIPPVEGVLEMLV